MSATKRWILIIIAFLFANAVAMGFLVVASTTRPATVLPHSP